MSGGSEDCLALLKPEYFSPYMSSVRQTLVAVGLKVQSQLSRVSRITPRGPAI